MANRENPQAIAISIQRVRCEAPILANQDVVGTVPLDRRLLPAFRQLAFVDQEAPKFGTAFTLENVRWHSIPELSQSDTTAGAGNSPGAGTGISEA